MKKVLYVGGFELPDKNAAAHRVLSNGKTLRMLGFDISFVGVTKENVGSKGEYQGFAFETLPYPTNSKEWFRHITEFVTVKKIESYHPNYLILYNFPAIASLRILKYCHKYGIKVIHDITEWELPEGRSPRDILKYADTQLRMKYCIKRMDGVIAISRYLSEYYSQKVKTILIPPTVDLMERKWNRERELTTGKNIQIVYAGSAGAGTKDRLDLIIDAIHRYPNILFKVVGMTQKQYIDSFGYLPNKCDNVIFMGRISHQEAVAAVCDADFQMLIRENTLKNRAGFPTKFVESMSCCTPVIATLTSNIGNYLIDGKNGFVVDGECNLRKVIEKVSKLSDQERLKMKYSCRDIKDFDYRFFEKDFAKLFF